MLADQSTLGPGGLPVSAASWLITVDTAAIPPGRVGPLGHRLSAVVASWRGRAALGGLQVSTGLPQVLAALASSLVVSRSLLLIGSLQLLLLATAAAALAARLLASQREGETAMLSARGAARGQLLLASLAEAVLLAVIGALAGIVAGSYLTDLLMSANRLPVGHSAGGLPGLFQGVTAGAAWWPAVVIVAGVIVVMMWPSLRPVTPGTARARRGRRPHSPPRPGPASTRPSSPWACWRSGNCAATPRSRGWPGARSASTRCSPWPRCWPWRGSPCCRCGSCRPPRGLLDRLSRRGRRLTAALASWQVSRRAVREGSPVLLVILAVATGTLALAQHQSWRQSQLDQAALTAGADVRVTLPAPLPLDGGRAIAAAHGVHTAMPVSVFNSGFAVLALGARQAAATVLLRPDLSSLPPAQLWGRITPRTAGPGLVLPGHPARLAVEASLLPSGGTRPGSGSGGLGAGQVSLSVQDGSGTVYAVRAGTLPADGQDHHLTAVLDAAGGARYPLRLLGLSVSLSAAGVPGAALPQRGGRAGGPAGRAAPGGHPGHAGHPRPGGLPADLRRLPGPVRRGGCPGRGGTPRPPPPVSPTRGPTGSRPPSSPGGPAGTRPR